MPTTVTFFSILPCARSGAGTVIRLGGLDRDEVGQLLGDVVADDGLVAAIHRRTGGTRWS